MEKSQNKWATKPSTIKKKKKEMLEKEEICFPELPHYKNKINNVQLKITRHRKKHKTMAHSKEQKKLIETIPEEAQRSELLYKKFKNN